MYHVTSLKVNSLVQTLLPPLKLKLTRLYTYVTQNRLEILTGLLVEIILIAAP